jgi:glycosyltransferase involved in cell wall biosynthesis
LPNLIGGGVEANVLNLARGFVERGHRVSLLLCRLEGPLLERVPERVEVLDLGASPAWQARAWALAADPGGAGAMLKPVLLPLKSHWVVRHLPGLTRYLRQERPTALLSAMPYPNLTAVWARRLAAVPTRVVVSERNTLSRSVADHRHLRRWRKRFLPPLLGRGYAAADHIIAVSDGVADDLSSCAGLPRDRITTVYNPVVTPDLVSRSEAPLDHPWFEPGAPPVVLAAGRLVPAKDFPTLLRAFARLRAARPARLMILGQGRGSEPAAALRALARELGVAEDFALPGFVDNPFAYMARASVFVLSSAWEGLPGALIQALACGCPVVSTDCPSGPSEILEAGRFGPLVPIGDDAAMAGAIAASLDDPPDPAALRRRAEAFSMDRAVDAYLKVLLPA